VIIQKLPDQPTTVVIKMAGGIYWRRTTFALAGTIAPQHAHSYDHLSVIVSGGVRVQTETETLGEFFAPAEIVIKAGVQHVFTTLTPNTIVACVHNSDRADGEPGTIDGEHFVQYGEA
jgi:quercetin dioxygenase-like cupin family protein